MRKITANVLVILFTIIAPYLSIAQVRPDLDNQDSLMHYLKMDKHPEYPEAAAFIMHKTLTQISNNYTTDITLDIALKVFKAQEAKKYTGFPILHLSEHTKLKELKIVIYNLENGKVQKTELNKRTISKTSLQNQFIKLTSTSNVKDGSIIHYQLTVNDEGFIPKLSFQEEIPVAYAALKLKLSPTPKIQKEEAVKIPFKEFTDKNAFYNSKLPAIYTTYEEDGYTIHSWIRRDLAPLEVFSGDKKNEMVTFSFIDKAAEKSRKEHETSLNSMTWQDYNNKLYTGRYRYAFEENEYLYDRLPKIIKKEKDSFIIANLLFKYIRDNFKKADIDRVFNFETIDEDKKATPFMLKLFLCALYRHAGLQSDLIYVSTDSKNPLTPDKVRERQTTIAVRVILNGVSYFCEPALQQLPFGYLPYSYYNGYTRLINKNGGAIILSPELAKIKYSFDAELSPLDNTPNKFRLRINENFGVPGSVYERRSYTDDSIAYKNDYKKHIEVLIPKLSISNYKLKAENLKNIDSPFLLIAEADIELPDSSGLLYFDPFLKKVNDGKNPFQRVKDRKLT